MDHGIMTCANPDATMNEPPSVGDVLCSSVSDARFLVIDPAGALRIPSLNGVELFHGKPQPCSMVARFAAGCELQGGRRYADPISGFTLMCIWPGRGSLHYEGRPLTPVDDACWQLPLSVPQARGEQLS
jgi:hypothetical protein